MKEYIVQATAQETIKAFDAHNAPELVRCKDCKHHGNINEDYCRCLEQETNNDFYCWYGERRTDP